MSEQVQIIALPSSKAALTRDLSASPAGVRTTPRAGGRRIIVFTVRDLAIRNWVSEAERLIKAADSSGSTPVVFAHEQRTSWATPSTLADVLALLARLIRDVAKGRDALQPLFAAEPSVLRRMIIARLQNAEEHLVASASVIGRDLIVWSCEPKLYQISADSIPQLKRLSNRSLKKFSISKSGSRIHWDDGDVDINLGTIRELTDPEYRHTAELQARRAFVDFGGAIQELRVERGLKQTDIAGLSDREVRRLESGSVVPHAGSLRHLANAHGMSLRDYLNELAKRGEHSSSSET